MNSMPSFLRPIAGNMLQIALNRALALDPASQERIQGWHGRKIAFKLARPEIALQVTVNNGKLTVGKVDADIEHDLEVDSDLTGLFNQSPLMRDAGNKLKGRLRISGDAELAREMQHLMANFEPDMQLPFVKLFGDVVGVQVAQGVKGVADHLKGAGKEFAQVSALYLTEESRDVVAKAEIERFNDEVDGLRNGVERIAARISRLKAAQ